MLLSLSLREKDSGSNFRSLEYFFNVHLCGIASENGGFFHEIMMQLWMFLSGDSVVVYNVSRVSSG
jgi:hypothetical protein